MQPVRQTERYIALDVIRGVALFGVLMVNLLTDFRVPLYEHILRPDQSIIGWLMSVILEFKSMDLFCLSFGMGIAIQCSRASRPPSFLARRFLVLLAFGMLHMIFIWNGDILTLYAVCGLMLIPLLRLRTQALAVIAVILLFVSFGHLFPADETIATGIQNAAIYATGSWLQILRFRAWETAHLIGPLFAMTLPKTLGLMLFGIVIWRAELHRRVHPAFAVPLIALGYFSDVPAALGAAILLFAFYRHLTFFRWAGQMALTNYLTESIVLSLIFYGFGLGQFGRLSPAPAASIGVALYIAQLFFSRYWLKSHRFGPFEYVWRWLTYGAKPLQL